MTATDCYKHRSVVVGANAIMYRLRLESRMTSSVCVALLARSAAHNLTDDFEKTARLLGERRRSGGLEDAFSHVGLVTSSSTSQKLRHHRYFVLMIFSMRGRLGDLIRGESVTSINLRARFLLVGLVLSVCSRA